jgi:AcrR family transcriptional regulator
MSSGEQNESKRSILKSAASLFAKLGLDSCSTREIAKVSNSNISLISYYFGGKEGLYKEVMRDFALEIKDEAQSLADSFVQQELTRELFIEDFEKIVDHIIKTRIENPELSKMFDREKLSGFPYSKEIYSEIFYPLGRRFFQLIETAQAKNIVKPDVNPELFFICLTESVGGFFQMMACQTELANDCAEFINDLTKLRNQIVSIYLNGVLK